jgi:glyoxylase-like metal-dependent hydrolase (beta-lactamase superfamily II)
MMGVRVTEGVTMIRIGGGNAYLLGVRRAWPWSTPAGPGTSLGSRRPSGRGSTTPQRPDHALPPDHFGAWLRCHGRRGAPSTPIPWMPSSSGPERPRSPSRRGRSAPGGIGLFGSKGTDPATVDRELAAGEDFPIAGEITAIHTPGHTPSHTSFLWLEGGVLFAGDAASNVLGQLGPGPADEDPAEADRSFGRPASLEFDVALFGHGRPVVGSAAARFRRVAGR